MMQRSDQLLTRAMLLEEVWNYRFVSATNLGDVHMGRLRHKVHGPGEAPMIHNVRGACFILRTGHKTQITADVEQESRVAKSDVSAKCATPGSPGDGRTSLRSSYGDFLR
ncbi:MAG TPA: helix-turn-helix domain-containing protein [Roseiarcus sp.]